MAGFDCCRHCVAPKRHPGCHATCPEYPIAKEEHDKKTAYLKLSDADAFMIENGSAATDKARKSRLKYNQYVKNKKHL